MRAMLILCVILTAPALADVTTETVAYRHGDTELQGFLAYPDDAEGMLPGVLVVHEWWGLNEHAKDKAEQLAEAGYVALALDMYGQGKSTEHAEEAGEWSKQVRRNEEMMQQRFRAAHEVLRDDPRTDPERIAAIGYCFGGYVVLSMAAQGAELQGVVSFHGSLPTEPVEAGAVKAKVLVCHGGADPLTTREQIQQFQETMTAAGADWVFITYGGAKHSFTNPEADERGMAPLGYDASADARSWRHMLDFFNEVL
ncbi:MAG: prolyl oligopeptidase family serine peptidase [Candidatus Eisenbacteria bacterium]|nr:prolyl oligopeptidase family serine peptidase [Candidatus Eisenbacteria bacterium]